MPTTTDYEQVPSSPLLYLLSCASIFVAWCFCWFMLICVVHPSCNLWMILNQSWNTYNVSKLDYKLVLDYMTLIVMHTITMQTLAVCCCLITALCWTQPRGCRSFTVFQELVQFCRNTLLLCSCSSQNAILGSGCLGQEETYCKFPLNGWTCFATWYIHIGYASFQFPSRDHKEPHPEC